MSVCKAQSLTLPYPEILARRGILHPKPTFDASRIIFNDNRNTRSCVLAETNGIVEISQIVQKLLGLERPKNTIKQYRRDRLQ